MEDKIYLILDETIACLYYEEAEKIFETKECLLTLATWETWKSELGEITMRLKGSIAKKLNDGKYDVIYVYTRFYKHFTRETLDIALEELIQLCNAAGIENIETINKKEIVENYFGNL